MNIRLSAFRLGPLLHGGALVALVLFGPISLVAVEPMILTSASKQFVVKGKPQRSVFASSGKDDQIHINPAVLVVSCERIKEAVARELGWINSWRGVIFVNVHPTGISPWMASRASSGDGGSPLTISK